MKRFPGAATAWAWLALFIVGCATPLETGGLSVNVTHVAPAQASLLEMSAGLTLRLTNETPQSLVLRGGSHRLYLNGTFVGRGVTNEPLTVPQLGTATQTVTVHLETLTLVRLATELSQAKAPAISYRLDSTFHPAEGQGWRNLRATSKGEFDLSAFTMPMAAPR